MEQHDAHPMELTDFIRADYARRYGLAGAPVDDPVTACAAAVDLPTIVAERDRCRAVEARCIVSRAAREFLDRVIATKG